MSKQFYEMNMQERLAAVEGRDFESLSIQEKMFVVFKRGLRSIEDRELYKRLCEERDAEALAMLEAAKASEVAPEFEAKLANAKAKIHVAKFRDFRNRMFKAFDSYKASVAYFGIVETEEERQEIETWYQAMKDFTEVVTEDTTISEYPMTPERIKYYL